jgi:hypothetical protein
LVNTHPGLAFAVGYVSHFLVEPREDHLAAVKKILCYVVYLQLGALVQPEERKAGVVDRVQ